MTDSRQRFTAVRTAPGDIQLTVSGRSCELSDAEAVDLALSLLASARMYDPDTEHEISLDALETWADQAQVWLDAQRVPLEPYTSFADRREALKPPPPPPTW